MALEKETFLTSNLKEQEQKINIYGREKFNPEKAKQYLDQLIDNFKEYYSSREYTEHPEVKITSGIDPSVKFIISHINVFKPYLAKEKVPDHGYYMRQDCVRTRNSNHLLEDEFEPKFGSYFPSLGTIISPEKLRKACEEAFDFLENELGISKEYIRLLVSSSDPEFLEICNDRFDKENIALDTKPIEFYRHGIGIDGIEGKNFNIFLKDPGGEGFSEVGIITLFENKNGKIGVETSFGSTTLLKQLYGLQHVLDCMPIANFDKIDPKIKTKFEDAIITSVILIREGLNLDERDNRERILKKYVQSLSYFRAKSKMSLETLSKIISDFEKKQLSENPTNASTIIIEYLRRFEEGLSQKNNRLGNKEKIYQALIEH